MKKKLLIYAHYYIPDTASTGQIVRELAEGLLDAFDITVICVVPSYSGKIDPQWKTQRFYREELNGVHVLRIRVPEFTKADKLSRIRNIVAYFLGARKATRMLGDFDAVFTISQPPVLGGMLGVYGKRKKKAPLVYNIQDFNPEQILAVNYGGGGLVTGLMMRLDKRSCRESDLVITVGRDLVETMRRRFEGERLPRTVMINNWIDEKTIYPLPADDPQVAAFRRRWGLEGKFVIMYSGNLGLYYDLENLLPLAKQFRGAKSADGRDAVFAWVGDGAVKARMEEIAREQQLDNCVFIPYQAKEDLIWSLNAGDVHWCVNARGIKGVSCPSKAYGIWGVGKPLLGVLEEGSEIRMLIDETCSGLTCEPGEYDRVAENIRRFLQMDADSLRAMGARGHDYLMEHLTRAVSVAAYRKEILALCGKEGR